MKEVDGQRLRAALEKATAALLAERNARGFWEGELSSSALSTATAVTALAVAWRESQISNSQPQIDSGLRWLAEHQNADGGWGDTTRSLSNISTTTLCWAAFGAASADEKFSATVQNAERWLTEKAGGIAPDQLAVAIIARYGKDRTFSVPILTMCALAGRLGEGRAAWQHVIPLPFELAACPHQLFAALRLPVVSYALPALIAIGQARHVHAPSRNPFARLIRSATRAKTLRKLTEIQPPNGGFLEATPLTSFVTMSLAASGQAKHVVTQRGLDFLLKSQRPDGSWPIDTNLSTWCTTLSIDALPSSAVADGRLTFDWLLKQQYTTKHPYTHAAPGGWAWTDLPGGVPDADDTAGALLALHKLLHPRSSRREEAPSEEHEIDQSLLTSAATNREEILRAAESGIRWLLDLQNRDGGIPTFCRGWGALPFDRSSADITAHAIRAWLVWFEEVSPELQGRMLQALSAALHFLVENQRPDGSWLPLWFGNEHAPDDENPTYGTARVLNALAVALSFGLRKQVQGKLRQSMRRAYECEARAELWLICSQRGNGGWATGRHGEATVEETALAVEALAALVKRSAPKSCERVRSQISANQGARWLIEQMESGGWREPAPIGFYFAKLWYYERLYPMIFTVGALRAASELDA